MISKTTHVYRDEESILMEERHEFCVSIFTIAEKIQHFRACFYFCMHAAPRIDLSGSFPNRCVPQVLCFVLLRHVHVCSRCALNIEAQGLRIMKEDRRVVAQQYFLGHFA